MAVTVTDPKSPAGKSCRVQPSRTGFYGGFFFNFCFVFTSLLLSKNDNFAEKNTTNFTPGRKATTLHDVHLQGPPAWLLVSPDGLPLAMRPDSWLTLLILHKHSSDVPLSCSETLGDFQKPTG